MQMDMSVNASVKMWNVTDWATDTHAVNFTVPSTIWKYFCMFDMHKGTNADPAVS